jgi:hypothetical protein
VAATGQSTFAAREKGVEKIELGVCIGVLFLVCGC